LKKLDVLVEPSIDEAQELLRKNAGKCLIIVGSCSVEYRGRASSKLGPGERIVLIKEDGALLVHRPTGYEPINWMPGPGVTYHVGKRAADERRKADWLKRSGDWQPPGCVYHAKAKDGVLEIHAVRQKPAESVKVSFDRIYLVSSLDLVDAGEFSLYASEEDMHKAILMEPSLLEEGFKPISYEKKVEPGFLDVYGEDKNGRLVVVEVKRKTAGKQAVIQLAKYLDAIRGKADRQVRGILAAPDIAKDVHKLLDSLGLEFKGLDPKKCAETLQRAETRKLAEFFKETQTDV